MAALLQTVLSATSAQVTLFSECAFLILQFSTTAVLSKVIRCLHLFLVQPLHTPFLLPAILFKATLTELKHSSLLLMIQTFLVHALLRQL